MFLAVGCAVHQRSTEGNVLGAGVESGSWASPAELSWLGKLGAWDTRLLRGLQTAARVETTPGLAKKLMERDGKTVVLHPRASSAGEPLQLGSGDEGGVCADGSSSARLCTFRLACTHLQRFHSAITLAVDQRQNSKIGEAQREAKSAAAVLLQADQMLPPGEVRVLPVIAGRAAESRVEPRFDRIASRLAGKPIEVRCWSTGDWSQLMREERSYTHGKLGSDTLGFAGIGGSRVNLGPTLCNGLVDLAYGHARPTDDAGQLMLAAAIVTLSHEPQHSTARE